MTMDVPEPLVTVAMLDAAARTAGLRTWADDETQRRVAEDLTSSFRVYALLTARRTADRALAHRRARMAKLSGELANLLRDAAPAPGELHPFGWAAELHAERLRAVEAIAKASAEPIHRPARKAVAVTETPKGWTKEDSQIRQLVRRMRLGYVELFAIDWHRSVEYDDDRHAKREGSRAIEWTRCLVRQAATGVAAPGELKTLRDRIDRSIRPLDLAGLMRQEILRPVDNAWADKTRPPTGAM